jgi:lipoprotein-releasing system permease protein
MLTFNGNVSGVVIRGIDPEQEGTVTDLEKYLKNGTLGSLEFKGSPSGEIKPQAKKVRLEGIIIGIELSKHLNADLGDKINVISPMGKMTPIGITPRIKKFRVVGIFDSGMYEYDSSLSFISIKAGQKFFRMGEKVTGIEVKVDDIYLAKKVAKNLKERLGFPYNTRDWIQMNKNLFSALKMEKIVMFIILTLIILVAAFNIVSTLIMVVMDKSRDIAILKSMGATNWSILKIFSIEGLIIGLLGTILGVAGGFIVVPYINEIVVLVEKYFSVDIFPGDIYYLDKLPSKINYFDTLLIVTATIFISFLATLYPAWQASKMDPVEALRYE